MTDSKYGQNLFDLCQHACIMYLYLITVSHLSLSLFCPLAWHTFCRTFPPSATHPGVETRHQYSLPKTTIPVCLKKIYIRNVFCIVSRQIERCLHKISPTKEAQRKPQRSSFEDGCRGHQNPLKKGFLHGSMCFFG